MAQLVANPNNCWKDLVKRKDAPINYFIVNLDGNKPTVAEKGAANGVSDVINNAGAGRIIYLRIDAHEGGAYDDPVIKQKFVRIQINPDQCKPMKLIQYRNLANAFNKNKAVHFEQTIKAAELDDITLQWMITRGKFAKSSHAGNYTFKFGNDQVASN